MLAAVNRFQNEKRNIEYVTLRPAQAGDIAQPTPETLAKYFDERKVTFRAPEYRKITLLPLTPAELAKPDTVTDADAKAYYEQHKNNYGTPERRALQQMNFPNDEEAAAAREKIAKGDELCRSRQGARPQAHRHRSRRRFQSRGHRSGDRGSRLQSQARRSERAGQGPVRHRAADGRQDRAGHAKKLRRGRRAT